jgi:hypothetical protein
MYFLNIHLAILKAIDCDYYTAVNIEVDQNASALVILSMILRSVKMSEYTNVIGGRVKSPPYEIIHSKTKEFLEKYRYEPLLDSDDQTVLEKEGCEKLDVFLERNKDVIDFICTSRTYINLQLCVFATNQTSQGRIEDFTEE